MIAAIVTAAKVARIALRHALETLVGLSTLTGYSGTNSRRPILLAMTEPAPEPKLHVDSDWKAQAEAEREKLKKIDSERTDKSAAGADDLPPADFRTIVGMLATQALGGLGAYGDPQTRRVVVDLPAAQFAIDLLGVLEAKTKGNLSAEEAAELKGIVTELRARFVQFAQMVAAQAAQGGVAQASTSPAAAQATAGAAPTAKSKIILPS